MLNLLNALSIFGKQLDVDTSMLLLILLAVQVAMILISVIVLIVLIVRSKSKTVQVKLDETVVNSEACGPIIIHIPAPDAQPVAPAPQPEPEPEPVVEPEPEPQPEPVVEPEPEPQPEPEPEPEPVVEPETEVVAVVEEPQPEPEVVAVPVIEDVEGGTLRYDKSFTARIIQSENEVKNWYTLLKNEMLSYKKVKARMSWKRENFRFGRDATIKLSFRGETLCIYLPIDPTSIADSKYKIEDVSDNASYAYTPCLYRIKNDKRVRYAMELIAFVMETAGTEKNVNYISEDFYMPYEGMVQLIEKGLVKRTIKSKQDEAIFNQKKEEPAAEAEAAATEE